LPVCLFALGANAAWAQDVAGPDRAEPSSQAIQRGATRRAGDSLSDSVRRIERGRRGQVLSAERIPFDGREVHRVKVLDDRGRVRVYMDDPMDDPNRRRSDGGRRPDSAPPPRARDDDD